MKTNQMKAVISAVRSNINLLKASKGEATLVGLENFSEEMLKLFDALYDQEVSRL